MKVIELDGMNLEVTHHKLSNGLKVVVAPVPYKTNYMITYGVRYGSIGTKFTCGKDKYIVPDGVAHFLEHKLFESSEGDGPFAFYSKTGSHCNAATTYHNTRYYCMGSSHFAENLEYLLKFVNDPYFTHENVEKEKGIIEEELKMYMDQAEYALEMKLRDNLYHTSNRRIDIGGSIESINQITEKDLYDAYHAFYTPSNMFLIVVGCVSVEDTLSIIEKEMGHYEKKEVPHISDTDDSASVRVKEDIIYKDIEVPKIGFGLKLDLSQFELKDYYKLDLYLFILRRLIFGPSSLFHEKIEKEKLVFDYYIENEKLDNIWTIYFIGTSSDPEKLLQEIKQEFSNVELKEEDFKRIKKVIISDIISRSDNIHSYSNMLYNDLLEYNKINGKRIPMVKGLSFRELQKVYQQIDFSNMSVVFMKKEN